MLNVTIAPRPSIRPRRGHTASSLALCLTASGLLSSALAAADWRDSLTFSGFASVGVAHLSEPDLAFAATRDEWKIDTDTMLGLQGQLSLQDGLGLTAQVVSRGFSYDNTSRYEPQLSWLFLHYDLAPDWQLRVGRLRTPHYLYSDTLEIGYSYAWVRPPVDVYTPLFEPLANFNGADLRTTVAVPWGEMQDADLDLQIYAGQTESEFQRFYLNGQKILGTNLTLGLNMARFRYSLMAIQNDIRSEGQRLLTDNYRLIAGADPVLTPLFTPVANQWEQNDGWFYYHGAGLQLFLDRWQLDSEVYTVLAPDEGFGTDSWGWYLSLQRRIGQLTPYGVIGGYRSKASEHLRRNLDNAYADLEALGPAPCTPGNETLCQLALGGAALLQPIAYDVIEQVNVQETTYTLGLRWDVAPQVAIKGEWQFFEFGDESTGNLFPDDPAKTYANTSMVSFVVDVVF